MNKLLVGIEIECEYNSSKITLDQDPYHNGSPQFHKKWFIEEDRSLKTSSRTFYRRDTCEIISKPFFIEELPTMIESLREELFEGEKMKDVMRINTSCGSHIHFSLIDTNKPETFTIERGDARWTFQGKRINIPLTDEIMSSIKNKVLPILSKTAQKRYYRTYARPVTDETYGRSKHLEFNVISDTHIEYRSINFCGVKSWKKLEELYMKAFKIIESEIQKPTTEERELTIEPTGESIWDDYQDDMIYVTFNQTEEHTELPISYGYPTAESLTVETTINPSEESETLKIEPNMILNETLPIILTHE